MPQVLLRTASLAINSRDLLAIVEIRIPHGELPISTALVVLIRKAQQFYGGINPVTNARTTNYGDLEYIYKYGKNRKTTDLNRQCQYPEL
jgi:hypothetical protein